MGILELVRDISDLVKKYNDQDLYERIVTLREEIRTLREDNIQLREEVKRLTDAAKIQADLIRDGNCYYRKDDAGREHPYCLTCWDYERKLVGLILSANYYGGGTMIKCGVCSAREKS